MAVQSYRDLLVWQNAMRLAEQVYRLTSALPKQEQYGLTAQMQRSAVSVPSNIAEGHARNSTKDFLRFLSIARGSLAELETQVLLAARLGYITEKDTDAAIGPAAEIGKMLNGLQAKLQAKLTPDP
ncbi:four helix bundle protein [Sinimarinibacterium flocculans]|uniref:four helix bundle protein n=1 Tax=Sinimarinibacterium flocculans TaxID=985250 RepID=UPI003515AEFF